MRELTLQDLEHLQYGATLFAAGGGGGWANTDRLRKKVAHLISQTGPLNLEQLSDLHCSGRGYVIAGVGKPNVLSTVDLGNSVERVAQLMSKNIGIRDPDFILSVETGANTFIAMMAAIQLQTPIIDCDGAGRAVPTLSCLSFTADGISIDPLALANITTSSNPDPRQTVLHETDVAAASAAMRKIISTPEYDDGLAMMACWDMTGTNLNTYGCAIPQTITLAIKVGQIIKQHVDSGSSELSQLLDNLNRFLDPSGAMDPHPMQSFGMGTITDLEKTGKHGTKGFDYGLVKIDSNNGSLEIRYQNENMTLSVDGNDPIAMYPDIISFLRPNGQPTTNADDLKVGDELCVVGLPAHFIMREGANPTQKTNLDAAAAEVRGIAGYNGPYVANPAYKYVYPAT